MARASQAGTGQARLARKLIGSTTDIETSSSGSTFFVRRSSRVAAPVLETCQCVESERALAFQAHAVEEFAGLPCTVLEALTGGAISSRFVTRLTSSRPRTPAIGHNRAFGEAS
jgi:hypothetical protein